MKEYLRYENLVETLEGPALYVEFKAYFQKSFQTYHTILEKYTQNLLDHYESSLNIRKSCYDSGFLICLLLDDLSSNWHESFISSDKSLYEFFKDTVGHFENVIIEEVILSKESEEIINFVLERKKNEFKKFEEQNGIHLFIQGKITAKTFDPMNIISLEDTLLHKTYLKVSMNNQDYLIQQPMITHVQDHFKNITKLHLIINDKPIENRNSLTIDGVGEIHGSYKKIGDYVLYLQVN